MLYWEKGKMYLMIDHWKYLDVREAKLKLLFKCKKPKMHEYRPNTFYLN
jgi:hypothetical protein